MNWVKLTFGLVVFSLLTSCDYDNEKTFKTLIWTAIETHHESHYDISAVKIHVLDTSGDDLTIYNESISVTERDFLKNETIFNSLSKASEAYNQFNVHNTEALKSSYMYFSSAISAMEDFLNYHQNSTFEDVSYVYYVYGATLEATKLCYTTYEGFKYHSKLTNEAEKKNFDYKILFVKNLIKNSGNQLGQYLAEAENSN